MESKTVNNLIMGGGCLVIAFALFYGKNNKIEKVKPLKVKNEYDLPEKFINDVSKMNNGELDKAISENTKYLENSKMLPQTREAIESMLKHLKSKKG
tara:strand:+ start:2217 stop:2507 length:291 start_codon:yes stop_codon:yes gene_type:complete